MYGVIAEANLIYGKSGHGAYGHSPDLSYL